MRQLDSIVYVTHSYYSYYMAYVFCGNDSHNSNNTRNMPYYDNHIVTINFIIHHAS